MTAIYRPTALQAAWQARSPRERRMLAAMALAVAAFLGWFALAAPLRGWAGEARQSHARALADQARLGPVLAAIGELESRRARTGGTAADLAKTAEAAGLQVRPRPAAGGALALEVEGPADALFGWLQQARDQGRYPREADIVARENGLRARLVFPAQE